MPCISGKAVRIRKEIREGTCYTGDKCDYCIVSEDNALMQNYVLVRNEDGLLVSRKRSREEI